MAAVTAKYETVMVLSMKLGEEGIQSTIEKFKALIEKHATLQEVDEWGKRRLAYTIDYKTEGYYVLVVFDAPAELPAELERNMKNDEKIMRYKVTRHHA